MKKITLCAALLFAAVVNAQEKLTFQTSEPTNISQKKVKLPFEASLDKSNYAELIGTETNVSNIDSKTPTNTLTNKRWGQLKNIEDDKLQTFEMNYTFGNNANVSIKLLNDDLTASKTIDFNIPTTTNDIQIITKGSKNIGPNDNKLKFFVYAHYFEGGVGPNFQKNIIYVYNEDGEKLQELNANFCFVITKENGKAGIITAHDEKTGTRYKAYDDQFNLQKEYFVEKIYTSNYAGNPFSVMKINGKEKLVFSQYEKQFMNTSMVVTPNNHLIVKIADMDLNFEKEVKLSLASKFPDQNMTFALGNFGTLPFGDQYAITSHNFNTDDNLEFIYALSYNDVLQDKTWINYYVASEDGSILKEINKDIIAVKGLSPVENQKDQIGFIVGDDNVISSIDMMNVATMEDVVSFPVIFNNQLLNANFDRFANNGSYSYMLGTNNGIKDIDTNRSYGIVNQVSKTGILERENRLFIGYNPSGFSVILNSDTLNPKVYNNDDDMEFSYVYFEKFPTGTKYFNTFSVSKGDDNVLFTKDGTGSLGDVKSSSFLRKNDNSKYNKLGVVYQVGNNPIITTEFYNLPLDAVLSTDETSKNNANVYVDRVNNTINWKDNADYQVYTMSGNMLLNGRNASKASLNGLIKGAYIIKLKTKTKIVSQKFLVK